MKTVIKIFILILAGLAAVKAFYYLTEKRHDLELADAGSASMHDDGGRKDETHAPNLSRIDGGYAVKVPEDIQSQAGIRLLSLATVDYRHEIHATGQVIDIQPLLDLRSRYHEIQGRQRIAGAALVVAQQDYDRLQQLHKEAANISSRELQQARLQMQTREAEAHAASISLEDIRQQLIQGWGVVMADLFLGDTDLFRALSMRDSVLIVVTVSGEDNTVTGTQPVYINALGDRAAAENAYFISTAVSADTRTQSPTYFFHAPASGLRTGMNVDVWLAGSAETQRGCLVPPEAVVWYADKPWIYVARDRETFARIALNNYTVTRQGWFVTEGPRPGDRIVVSGSQMLLSQEFRWSIPDEDDNP